MTPHTSGVLPSIHRRLSKTLIGVSIGWGIAVSAVVWSAVHHEVDDLLDNGLQESAEILFGLLSFNASSLSLQGGAGWLPAPLHDESLVWQIVSPDQKVLLRSHRAPPVPLVSSVVTGFSTVDDEWRVYSLPFDTSGRMLYVAQTGRSRHDARVDAAIFTVSAALLVGVLCAYVLRWRIRHELEPISELSQAVVHFDPLRPESQLGAATRAELTPMHSAITELGARLARRLRNERAFSAHAAHALRTPLAGLSAQLAVAQRVSSESAQPHLHRAREAAERLRRVVTALLTLFRTSADINRQAVSLPELIGQLSFEPLALTAHGVVELQVDGDLLAAALMNLLDNALRHGATQVDIQGSLEPDGHVVVRVLDNGSGMAEAKRLQLQARLDTQQYEEQMGLGLMLADLIARAHGGRLHIEAATTGCAIRLDLGPGSASR